QGTEAYELKIALLKQLGRGEAVVPSLSAYGERDPQNLALRVLLGREYHRAGRVREAEDIYSKLADKTPTAEIYKAWFTLLKEQNRMGEALSLLDRAVAGSLRAEERGEEGKGQPDDPRALAENAAKSRAMVAVLQEEPALVRALLPAAREQLLVPRAP